MPAWLAPALPGIIQGASSVIGGIIGQDAADEASKFARMQFKFQQKSAKRGITWRVKDAINAGIHPLYALGAQTFSPSPISVSGGSPLAEGIANMGQGIGSAVQAGMSAFQTQAQRLAETLSLQRMVLENKLLAGQIAGLRKASVATVVPGQGDALEVAPPAEVSGGAPVRTFLGSWERTPGMTTGQQFEDDYGEFWGSILATLPFLGDWINHDQSEYARQRRLRKVQEYGRIGR